ncbi:MAG: D-alanyl-D-alanine carboxypeptidase family protein [Micavibrio sp.]
MAFALAAGCSDIPAKQQAHDETNIVIPPREKGVVTTPLENDAPPVQTTPLPPVAVTPPPVVAAPVPARLPPRNFVCRSTLMMDLAGNVLTEDEADVARYPASIAKVMTLLMVFDALKSGSLQLDDKITFSKNAASKPSTHLNVAPGTQITVEQAIKALVTQSANDVATALAEHLGGTERKFGTMMTTKARALGMSDSTFRNASGLPDPAMVTTARDIARMSQALLTDYAAYYHYFSLGSFTYRGNTYYNHNRLLGVYPGVDGIKTGFTRASLFNLALSAERPEGRLIVAVFGCPTSKARNAEVADLLDDGFAALRRMPRAATPTVP